MKLTRRALGHSFFRSLFSSNRSIRTARFVRPFHCAHSLARSRAHWTVIYFYELIASISYSFNPQIRSSSISFNFHFTHCIFLSPPLKCLIGNKNAFIAHQIFWYFSRMCIAEKLKRWNEISYKSEVGVRKQISSATLYRVLGSKCRQKNLNFSACMIDRIIWIVLIDHKFDVVLTDIVVGSVLC